ncbi:hypothetical protein L3X38_033063 [Prunus dulcis]|uniref:RNase H type-1 domain-containing protein n=1 Tax=Prunus dulcis TaxID=3755 RepID=A0AAD4VF91_PRUDU|nr:hypothetical protein L3X38_033063 [Prunus dulcis]
MGRAAAINRFLSRSTNKCKSFFKALKKGQKHKWNDECKVPFQNLKNYLTSPPLLSKSVPGEDLFSSSLIREELEAQHLVFYTSKALLDSETRYPKIERLILSLVVSARKLRRYHQAHRIILQVDRASNHKGAGAGIVIITPNGTLLEQAIKLSFPTSNNKAKYKALLAGLRTANKLSIKRLAIYSDSQKITNQASWEYRAKHQELLKVEHLDQASIEEAKPPDLMQIDKDSSWQNPIIE